MRTESAPQTPRQPKALLVDDRIRREIGEGLIPLVARLRAEDPPATWQSIADRLTRLSQVPVSRQLLQQWAATWDLDQDAA